MAMSTPQTIDLDPDDTYVITAVAIYKSPTPQGGNATDQAESTSPKTDVNLALAKQEPSASGKRTQSSSVDCDEYMKQKGGRQTGALVVQIKRARRQSDSNVGFVRRSCVILLSSLMFLLLNLILLAIPVSKVIMASVYFHDCPAQPLIAIFLLVDGSVASFRILLTIVMKIFLTEEKFEDCENKVSAIASVLLLLELAWFVVGSVYVYKTLFIMQTSSVAEDHYCNPTFYWYAFWIVTASYLVILCLVAVVCLAVCAVIIMVPLKDEVIYEYKGPLPANNKISPSIPDCHNTVIVEGATANV